MATYFGGPGNDTLGSTAGDDTFFGLGGNDTLNGGAGVDTSVYGIDPPTVNFPIGMGPWTVTAGSEGTDTLNDIEVVAFGSVVYRLVGAGGYDTISAALADSSAGDTILVAAGVYDEDLVIDKAVTILGAHAGEAGSAMTRDAAGGVGETTIIGRSSITTPGGVTIDGVRFLNDVTTSAGGAGGPTLKVAGSASGGNHVITNSVFWSVVVGGANGVDDRALSFESNAAGSITVSDNLISGSTTAKFTSSAWGRGVWFDGGGVLLNVTDNVFQSTRTGMNLDVGGASDIAVSGNSILNATTGVSGGVNAGLVFDGIVGNNFQNVDNDFNLRNLTTNLVIDAEVAVGVVTPVATPSDLVVVLGGVGQDDLLGTSGADYLEGNNLTPAALDSDILEGRGGDDLLVGQGGTDTARYVGTITTAQVTAVADANPLVAGNQAGWQVAAGAEGTDLLLGVEIVDGAGPGRILLVGSGGFATIQAAVDAAASGDTILVAAGTYTENVTIDENVDVHALNPAPGITTIAGSVTFAASGTDAMDRIELDGFTVTGGIVVGARDHIAITNTVASSGTGSVIDLNFVGSADDIVIDGVTINATGGQNGLRVSDNANVTALSVTNSVVNGGQYGFYFANETNTGDSVTGTFADLTFNGQLSIDGFDSRAMYLEKLSDATIMDIVVNAHLAPANTTTRAVHLNLKNGTFQNISIDGVDLVGFETAQAAGGAYDPLFTVGVKSTATLANLSVNDVTGTKNPGATGNGQILVDIFSETLVLIDGLTLTNVNVSGEVKVQTTTDAVIQNNTVTGNMNLVIVDVLGSLATNTVTGAITLIDNRSTVLPDGADNLLLASGAGNINGTGNALDNVITGNEGNNVLTGGGGIDTLDGGNGNDQLAGGTGNDTINGGANDDTLVLVGNRIDYSFSGTLPGPITVTGALSGATDGVDIVSNVEFVQFADRLQSMDSLVNNVAPNDIAFTGVVSEAAMGPAAVGTATASDANTPGGDTVTFSFAPGGNPGGLFAIHATTGAVTLAGTLNAEAATSHMVMIRATDGGGLVYDESFVIDVTDSDETPISAITDTNAATNEISEAAALNATVGITANATDPDETAMVSYSLTDSAGGRFAINASTGVVTLAMALDAEAASSHSITVQATSTDELSVVTTSSQSYVIDVLDSDETPISAITDTNAAVDEVSEAAMVGATVGITANATDPDETAVVSYSLSNDAGGRFAINASTGVVTLAMALDAETNTNHSIIVLATSTDELGIITTSSQAYVVDVLDFDDFDVTAPVDTDGPAGGSVTSTALAGTLVGIDANAVDADETTNTVTYTLSDSAGGRFQIDSVTGIVAVAPGGVGMLMSPSHNIVVQATSADGSIATTPFTVFVTTALPTIVVTGTPGNDSPLPLAPVPANYIVDGLAGADTIVTNVGADIVRGNAGDDTINTGDANDIITFLGTGDGFDIVDGGNGTGDEIRALGTNTVIGLRSFQNVESITANGNTGVVIRGSTLADTLNFNGVALTGITLIDGNSGNDTITGTAFADTIAASGGDDTLNGGDGDDFYNVNTGAGFDVFNGGNGNDTIRAMAANVAIGINSLSSIQAITSNGFGGTTIVGTTGNNTLDFSTVALTGINLIDGGSGSDTVTGSAGDDIIAASTGDDTLNGFDGNDTFRVGSAAGFDAIHGGSGNDTVIALASNMSIKLTALSGIETISNNTFNNVTILGSTGNNVLDFSTVTLVGIGLIDGGDGVDTITGTGVADTIAGGNGQDTINAGAGADTIRFGVGTNDFVDGGADTDTLRATAIGSTILWPNVTGVEIIDGTGFAGVLALGTVNNDVLDFTGITLINTTIDGGSGIDTITGSAGNDTINGNLGNDIINGAAGNDTILFGTTTLDVVNGGADFDTLKANIANASIVWTNVTSVEAVVGTGFTGVTLLGTAGVDVLDFSAVSLTDVALIDGGSGNDTIIGTSGIDVITGNTGTDNINAGDGADFIRFNTSNVDTVNGGNGTDTLIAMAANSSIVWTNVSNVEVVDANGQTGVALLGTSGNNTLDFSGVSLLGSVRLDGAAGNDTIIGTAAADLIVGGAGKDFLTGGLGADLFDYNLLSESTLGVNADEIQDFVQGIDKVDLSTLDANGVGAGNGTFNFIGNVAFSGNAGELRFDTGTPGFTRILGDTDGNGVADIEVRLVGVLPYTLVASDFIL